MTAPAPLLSVEDLRIAFNNDEQRVVAVNGVSFTVSPGQVVGIAGESGSGKSTVAHAILRLLPASAQYESGRILFQDRDLATLSPADLRGVRGGGIGMIFQEPMSSLNPLHPIGAQVAETIRIHQNLPAEAAMAQALSWLERVRLRDAAS
ncbi:MAG TPA: microcin ABC transporter ATP-binding protein, partial [Alphaproteobacteria bacterium]|nr:microcin ABC transporter ATP-binding protein [Alphaproteobacteria bacterium]